MKQADGHGVEAMPGLRPVKGGKYYKPKFGFSCKAKRIGGGTLAHGDGVDGVNRSSTGYPIGNCAHCHDTFDEAFCGVNELMLFEPYDNPTPTPQEDNFCYTCHGSGSAQAVTNHTYSTNFGGGTDTFITIYDAFNPTTGVTPSSHNLADLLDHAVGTDIGLTSSTNPCLVCHDQHLAQQNYPVTPSGLGGVKTAVRRPVENVTPPENLWGDETSSTPGYFELTSEIIENQGLVYQAPYYLGGSTYEPVDDSTSDGSNLSNIITFCLDCHKHAVPSTERGRNLRQIDWTATQHGKSHQGGTAVGASIAPYTDHNYDYILVCTHCHEPHGSENEWLLRTTVNGKDGISMSFEGDWYEFCTACHVMLNPYMAYHTKRGPIYPTCPECHEHNETNPNNNF